MQASSNEVNDSRVATAVRPWTDLPLTRRSSGSPRPPGAGLGDSHIVGDGQRFNNSEVAAAAGEPVPSGGIGRVRGQRGEAAKGIFKDAFNLQLQRFRRAVADATVPPLGTAAATFCTLNRSTGNRNTTGYFLLKLSPKKLRHPERSRGKGPRFLGWPTETSRRTFPAKTERPCGAKDSFLQGTLIASYSREKAVRKQAVPRRKILSHATKVLRLSSSKRWEKRKPAARFAQDDGFLKETFDLFFPEFSSERLFAANHLVRANKMVQHETASAWSKLFTIAYAGHP